VDDKKILIIHLSRLGDMIQSLPSAKRLKEDRPQSTITYLGIEEFCHVLSEVPWIDNLVTFPWQQISPFMGEFSAANVAAIDSLWEMNPKLHQEYDLLINLTHNWSSSYLSEKIAAKVKKGRVYSQNNEIVVAGKWGKYLFSMSKNQKDNLLNLVDIYMGMVGAKNRPAGNFLPTCPKVDRQCISQLSDLGLEDGKLTVGFQLGASNPNKRWLLKNFVVLGEHLVKQLDAQIILFGSEKDASFGGQFRNSAAYPFIDLIGRTKVTDLGSFFKAIDVLVSNDTGPMHIAAAVGTKVVGIFMSTAYFGVTGAYGSGHVAIQSNYPCAPCLGSTVCYNPPCTASIQPGTVEQAVRLCLGLGTELSNENCSASLYKSAFNSDGTLQYHLVNGNTDEFLAWLSRYRYLKAAVSQTLLNNWLGLQSNLIDAKYLQQTNGQLKGIMSDFQTACLEYQHLYASGVNLCRQIIDQFERQRPNVQRIQIMVESLGQLEEKIKALQLFLPILKEIHEYYFAETEVCNFPRLAHQFLDKYRALEAITAGFESTLQKIDTYGEVASV